MNSTLLSAVLSLVRRAKVQLFMLKHLKKRPVLNPFCQNARLRSFAATIMLIVLQERIAKGQEWEL